MFFSTLIVDHVLITLEGVKRVSFFTQSLLSWTKRLFKRASKQKRDQARKDTTGEERSKERAKREKTASHIRSSYIGSFQTCHLFSVCLENWRRSSKSSVHLVNRPKFKGFVPRLQHFMIVGLRVMEWKDSTSARLDSIPFHSIPFHSIPFHSIPCSRSNTGLRERIYMGEILQVSRQIMGAKK